APRWRGRLGWGGSWRAPAGRGWVGVEDGRGVGLGQLAPPKLWTPRGWCPGGAAPLEAAPVPGYGRGRRPGSKLRRARASASAEASRGSPHTASAWLPGGVGRPGPGQGVDGDPVRQVEQHPPDPDREVAAPGAAGGVDDRADVGVPARRRGGRRR
ncbi:MAG TPA: hypothetical protein VF317_11190, partial [Dermatophilaceae bacterium]